MVVALLFITAFAYAVDVEEEDYHRTIFDIYGPLHQHTCKISEQPVQESQLKGIFLVLKSIINHLLELVPTFCMGFTAIHCMPIMYHAVMKIVKSFGKKICQIKVVPQPYSSTFLLDKPPDHPYVAKSAKNFHF